MRLLHLFLARLSFLLFVLLVPLYPFSTCSAQEPKRDRASEVVSAMLKAYGGVEAIKKVVSVTAKGKITEFTTGRTGSYARYFERPGKLRIEVMPELGGDVRILNRDRGWQASRGGLVPVSSLELQSMLYQYSYLNLPMGLASGSYHAKYGGKQPYKGASAYLLLVEPENAPRLGILVDAKSYLILRVDASFAVGMGTGELATEYGDYRPVAGVQFPRRLTSFAGGLKLAEIDLDTLEVNTKIPADFFGPEPEQIEKPKKPEKPEKLKKPEKAKKPEKRRKPEKIEKPEKPQQLEKPEQPAVPEKPVPETPGPEKPEIPGEIPWTGPLGPTPSPPQSQ